MSDSKIWLITGASSGLGLAYARGVLDGGDTVIATARRAEPLAELVRDYPGRAFAKTFDVTDAAAAKTAVDETIAEHGRIDVLVNNAGAGLFGAIEELTADDLRHQFELNVLGAHNLLRAALPHMRAAKSGHVVNVSSMSGFSGAAGMGAYNVTKFALEGLSEALAQEVGPLGIKVTILEPGPFSTGFDKAAKLAEAKIADYEASSGKIIAMMTSMDWAPGDPARAARVLVEVVRSAEPPLRIPFGQIAYDSIREKLTHVGGELDRWRDQALSTDAASAQAQAAE